ncbi:MAG: acetate--CoA ligase family protein [bacterium]
MDTSCLGTILGTAGHDPSRIDPIRLNEPEVFRLLQEVGLAAAPVVFLSGQADAAEVAGWAARATALGGDQGRVLLKVVGRDILHKTEAGGVEVVDLAGADAPAGLLAAKDAMLARVRERGAGDQVEGFLAAAFVPHRPNTPGQELILALKQDPAFGPCVVVGIGGTLTEWFGALSGGGSTLVFPAAGLEAGQVAAALAAHPALKLVVQASRLFPEPPVEVQEVVQVIMGLADLGRRYGPRSGEPWTIEELEVNPAVASGGHLVALDGVALVSTRKWADCGRPVRKIGPLLQPRSAVVMGVSAKGGNPGRIILDNLRRSAGIDADRLYVVHAREQEIAGVPCFPSVAALPEKCDLAVVSVPAEGALTAIEDLIREDRTESIILIPGGFAEAGQGDLARAIEDRLVASRNMVGGGPVMVGANCLGIVSRDNYNTFFLPPYKLPFSPGLGENLAIVSQSGAYVVTFASNYDGVIQPRASISFGNQMDLTVSDFLEYFNEVGEVDVIACYVEGFRPGDGERFLSLARAARDRGKRVIIFKAGKTALGARAAASHTASLAGDYAVARSCLLNAGVTVAESLDEFEDLIMAFTLLAGKVVRGDRVGIISNAGFECSTIMDRLGSLKLAEFDRETQAVLDEVLPAFAHRTNPIDCTPMTGTEAFAASCRAILECGAVDAAVLSSVPVTPALDNLPRDEEGRHREDLAGPGSQVSLMIPVIRGSAKPAVVVVDSGEIYDPMCRSFLEAGIPVFRKIDRAARALGAFCLEGMTRA